MVHGLNLYLHAMHRNVCVCVGFGWGVGWGGVKVAIYVKGFTLKYCDGVR